MKGCIWHLAKCQITLSYPRGRYVYDLLRQNGNICNKNSSSPWIYKGVGATVICQSGRSTLSYPRGRYVYDHLRHNGNISSPWIWKSVSATLPSVRYTLSYPRGRFISLRKLTLSSLSPTIVDLIRFISRLNHCYLKRNRCLNIKICKGLVSN